MQRGKNYFCIWTRQRWSLCSFSVPVGDNSFLLVGPVGLVCALDMFIFLSVSSKCPQKLLRGTSLLCWLGSLCRDKGHKFLLVPWQRLHFIDGGTLHPRQQQAACSCWHIHIIPINPNCSSSAFVRPKGHALSWIHLQSFCSLNEDKFLLSRQMVL